MTLNRRNFLSLSAATAGLVALGGKAFAMKSEIFTGIVKGVGAGAHDVVAYFTQGKPVKGTTEFSASYKGADWHFSSAENRDLFAANPAKYAPKYGGHCAYAASKGYIAKGDPLAWTVYEDKLYLNFSLQVRDIWSGDIPGNIKKADANWPKLIA